MKYVEFLVHLDKGHKSAFGRALGNAVGVLSALAISICLASTVLYAAYKYLMWLWQ